MAESIAQPVRVAGEARCVRCDAVFALDRPIVRCDRCDEPVEVRQTLEPMSLDWFRTPRSGSLFERYAPFYGFPTIDPHLSLGEGRTSLLRAPRLAAAIGLGDLYLKNETQNPTWTFKDRGTALSVQQAVALGYRRFGTLSSGNMAASVAAFGARAALDSVLLLKANTPAEKIGPVAVYGATALLVEGDYSEVYRKALEAGAQYGIYFAVSDEPLRVEGYKTLAFEVFEQLGFGVPEYLAAPVGSGGLLRGIMKGFEELRTTGIAERMPTFVGVQSEGCSPIVDAYDGGRDRVERFLTPETLDHVLENPLPPSGNEVLRKIRSRNGLLIKTTHEEILKAMAMLAAEGVFAQPASATALAGLGRAVAEGRVPRGAQAVTVVTGSGLKYPAVLPRIAAQPVRTSIDRLHEALGRGTVVWKHG